MWVARRVPDGLISAHANQARIRAFPLDDSFTTIAFGIIRCRFASPFARFFCQLSIFGLSRDFVIFNGSCY